MMPSAGVRPVITSQNCSRLPTPVPSTCGQVTSAGARVGLAGGFGAGGFVAGGLDAVFGAAFLVDVCAPAAAVGPAATAARRTMISERLMGRKYTC